MFSKAIFQQTLKSNWKLWAIFTSVLCVLSALIIAVFNPQMISSMLEMMRDLPIANMFGAQMGGITSLLGMLGESFYSMHALLLPLIFVTMTANSLIAAQVDRGSMAYLLSTPTTRAKVVQTQALYMVTAIFLMFVLLTTSGLVAVQAFQGGVLTVAHTEDVKAVAALLDLDEEVVAADLRIILGNEQALIRGAAARGVDKDVYIAYLNLKIADNSFRAAAAVLGVELGTVRDTPSIIADNAEALSAAAKVMGLEVNAYRAFLASLARQRENAASEQARQMQQRLLTGINAAATVLEMDAADLLADMGRIKASRTAIDAFLAASGMPEVIFLTMINEQLASDELLRDDGIAFSVRDYVMLNMGVFLLMFAISGVAFMFSCIFNLSKDSLAFGTGIPMAFFIVHLMARMGDNLESFKYFTLNTLFDPAAITGGGSYALQFAALGLVGIVLYGIGIRVFKEKDLPL